MRHKLRLLNLVLIVVFIFSFTACTTPKTTTETTTAETIITETTATVTTTEAKETATETTQAEVKKEFSLSMVGNLYISGYTPTVWVEGDDAYLTSGDSFKIIDVSDKENPKILASVGMDITGGYIGNDFCVKDNYAYIPYQVWDQKTNTTKESGFEVIDIGDKKNPKIVGGYKAKGQIINIFIAMQHIQNSHSDNP